MIAPSRSYLRKSVVFRCICSISVEEIEALVEMVGIGISDGNAHVPVILFVLERSVDVLERSESKRSSVQSLESGFEPDVGILSGMRI